VSAHADAGEQCHQVLPVQTPDLFRSAIVITIATLVGHPIPLAPFIWAPRTTALILAIVFSVLVLFGVGAYEAVTLVGAPIPFLP
jgi:VIT1/CCC1 family predicted Fe2+/Mn2+ transporter